MPLTRRQFITAAAASGLGLTIIGRAEPLFAASSAASRSIGHTPGYGPLVADPQSLLDLPEGFHYSVVSRAGDPLTDRWGNRVAATVPGRQDGASAFPGRHHSVLIVQNHEQGQTAVHPVVADPSLTYDPLAKGGTTTIRVDHKGRRLAEYVSLAGTWNNCAGGRTPWRTWLTCEETEQLADGVRAARDHGYVFEVDPYTPSNNRRPEPLVGLGRFAHEAVAVDPKRGHLYLTEDASGPNGLLYRFTPNDRSHRYGSLRSGGLLEAMRVKGLPDLSPVSAIGSRYAVEWVRVPDPSASALSTRKQFDHTDGSGQSVAGAGGAVTRSRKLEGAYWRNGRAYVVASFARTGDGSAADHDGQVWAYDPCSSTIALQVRFSVNPDPLSDRPDGPDNIYVTPSGGVVLAEDGQGVQHLLGVNAAGESFMIARNALSNSEFAGPTFSPDGKTLFACIQDPGIVYAIRGPWKRHGGLQ